MPEKSSLNVYSRGAQEHSCCAVANVLMHIIITRERRIMNLLVFVAATILGDDVVFLLGRGDVVLEYGCFDAGAVITCHTQ